MKKQHLVPFIVLCAVIVTSIKLCTNTSTEVKHNQEDFSITKGNHHLKAAIVGREITDSFLIIGGAAGGNIFFTAHFSVIPLDVAEQLAKKYGNFRRCDSAGAAESKKSVRQITLYTVDRDVEQKLKDIGRLAMAYKSPVIEITYKELKTIEHTIKWDGKEAKVPIRGSGASYIVTDVQLIEKNQEF